MTSYLNNSYVFGLGSGVLVQQLVQSSLNKDVPLYLTIPASMIAHRILQSIPKAISYVSTSVEKNAELVDRNIAQLTVPTTCLGLIRSYFSNSKSHFIDLAAKTMSLAALNDALIKPTIVYISPTKRFFDAMNHPFTQTASSLASNSSIVQFVANHPATQLTQFLTKVSIAKIIAEGVNDAISFSGNYSEFAYRGFAALTLGSFLSADLALSKKTAPIATPIEEQPIVIPETDVTPISEEIEMAEPISEEKEKTIENPIDISPDLQ